MCRRTLKNAKSTDFSADSLPDLGHRLVDYHHDSRSSTDGLGCARDLRDHLPDCAYLVADWILGIPGVWAWRSQVSNPEQQLRIDLATFFAWASMSCWFSSTETNSRELSGPMHAIQTTSPTPHPCSAQQWA